MNQSVPKTLQEINTETMNQAFQAMLKFGFAMMDLERQKQQRRSQKRALMTPIVF